MLRIKFKSDNDYSFSASDTELIHDSIIRHENKLRQLLPGLSQDIEVAIIPTTKVIPETGASGRALSPVLIEWLINPWDQRGVEAIVRDRLKGSLFHEAHHANRMITVPWGGSLLDKAIFEGLGSVFQRDYAGDQPPWASYDMRLIAAWTNELLNLNSATLNMQHYFFDHPDGRKWIAYRVGAYIVDQAIKNSPGTTSATLVDKPANDIIKLAKISSGPSQ